MKAWKDGDDEIETYYKKTDWKNYCYFILLIAIPLGLIAGQVILSSI